MSKLATFLQKHDGTKEPLMIFEETEAFIAGKAREISDDLAQRIEAASFASWFSIKDKPAPKAEKTPVDPAKE